MSDSILQVLQAVKGATLKEEGGSEYRLELLPAATAEEIISLEAVLPHPLPAELKLALNFSKGFANGPLETLSLLSLEPFGLEDLFPFAYPIGHDGFGNYWVVDVTADGWGPVYYACHDPPVIAYQAATIQEFLRSAVALNVDGPRSDLDLVHEEVVNRIWKAKGDLADATSYQQDSDPAIRGFVESLPLGARLVDLRSPKVGDGFPWGVFGPKTQIVRHGTVPVWAVTAPEKRPGLFARLFG